MSDPLLQPPGLQVLGQPKAGDADRHVDTRTAHVPTVNTEGQCHCCTSPLATFLFCCAGGVCLMPCGACRTIQPRTQAVGTVFGKYVGTWTSPGLYCINPCGFEWNLVSVNNRATELSSVKCADSAGNSLVVSGVITFRVVDAARAVLDMGPQLDQYVHVQGQAVLKRVSSRYRYITYDGSPSLITEQAHLGEMLRAELQVMVDVAGVAVESFMLSDLAYAKEIAAQMLVRQQAQATIDARKMIVSGAVGIACDALAELQERGKPVNAAEQGKFVSNLVMVICAEKSPVPMIEV